MEEGLSETGDTDELSARRRKMEGLSLQLASQPTSDLPVTSSTFIDTNNPTLSFPFTAPIHFSLDELSNLSSIKEEKDIRLHSQISKMSENSYDNKNELKVYSDRSELADMKELSPLQMLAVSAFQELGQQSPASTSQAGPQVLRYQTSGGGGDAMLSAINYNNDSEMLNESAFDMNSTNTQLDEGIMGNPSQNIRLSEGQGSHTYDLFDGNVNEALSLSPLAETGLIVDEGGISDTNQESNILDEQNQGLAQDTNNGTKKGKKNLTKTQFSPMKQNLVCPTCGKSFNNSSALAKHRLTHSEERKYICSVCHKGFKRQDHLNGHLMTHRDKKPYECQEENCEKSYCDARSLRRHLEGHHHQTPEAIAASVLASMHAAGISNNSQSNGKPRASDQRAFQEATQMLQISSPSYSGNTTPSPSPNYTNTAQTGGKQFFPFDQQHVQNVQQQQQQQQQQQTVVSQPAPKTTTTQGGNSKQSWQSGRNPVPVYNYVSNPFTSSAPGNSERSSGSGGYSPVSPVPQVPNTSASATPHLATHQRQLWFNNTTPADMVKASEDVVKPPVSCTICEKKFKNIPALNGHMRLHGGYMKKEKGDKDDTKKSSKSKTKTVKQPPPRLPSSHQSTAQPSQVQNILPSIVNQSLQILKSPQYTSTGQSVAQPASVQPLSAQQPQQLASEQSSNFVRQQHPILQHQLQIHALQQQQQQQQQQVQASEQHQTLAAQNLQPNQSVNPGNEGQQADLSTIPHPALLQVHGVTPDQILPIHQLNPVQQQLVQQQLQQLTLAAVPNLIQQSIQLPPSLTSQLNQQQLETLQQLQPNQIQQLIQEQHLQNQRQLQEQQQQQQLANKAEDSSNQMTESQVQGQYELQQQQMLAEQNRALLQQQQHSLGLQGIQSIDIGQQETGQEEMARQRLQEQQAQIENMDLNQISQTLLGLQSQGMTLPSASNNPSSGSVSYNQRQLDVNASSPFISGNDVDLPQHTQRQDVGMFGSVSEGMPQEGKLSNIQPTLHQLSMSQPVDSSRSTIDSIQRDLMESHPKVIPCVSSCGDSVLRNELLKSQNFRPISSSHSEVRRRLSADSERTISPQHSHANLTMLLTKGPQFVKPRTLTDFSPPSGRVRMRSKSGDDHIRAKLMRSKSIDPSFMRPRSQTEDSLFRERHGETVIGRSKSHADDVFSKSAGASVFRNPGILTSPVKFKRKHRPAPLFIPPHLNSFQSRLRSPRLWDGSELKGPGHGHTPPPYTPPPMLSPNRRSSGLFCSIQSARPFTPRSAPITPRLLPRKSSVSKPELEEEEIEDLESEDTTPPPETDTKPHINVGAQYQAALPQFNPNIKEALRSISREDVMWEPFAMADNTDDEVQYYQDFACCAAVKGNGVNVEYALHLLYMAKGNIQNAILMLMEEPPKLPSYHTLLTYYYQESDSWSTEEIENFHKGLNKFDKDFFNVSNQVGSKNVKQCVQFYYLWKKVCPEDYKRLRIIRRKREQEDLYNLRSRPAENQTTVASNLTGESESESSVSDKTEEPMEVSRNSDISIESSSVTSSFSTYTSTIDSVVNNTNYTPSTSPGNIPILTVPSPQPTTFTCDHPNCRATFNSKPALSGHRRMHSTSVHKSGDTNSVSGVPKPVKPRQPRPKARSSPGKPSPVLNDQGEEIFPCRLCDRIFSKVKSRSAHMKSHKIAETEKTKSKTVEMIKVAAAMIEPEKLP